VFHWRKFNQEDVSMTYGYRRYFRLIRLTFFPGRDAPPMPFRRRLILAAILPALMIVQAVHWMAFLIDDLLFRGYRRIAVKQPLFIVGVPRSGTTYLHRLLSEDRDRFTVFRFWELLLAPAVCERKFFLFAARMDGFFGSPLKRMLIAAERRFFSGLDDMHRSSLFAPEEDYFGLLPICACFLTIALFPHDEALWRLARFDEAVSGADQDRIMAFHYRLLQRHLYVHGRDRRILSKNPSFSSMVRALDRTYPDCKIVCCLRNPLQAIPSLISSMTAGARILGNGAETPEFQARLAGIATFYYRHLTDHLSRMPADRHAFLTMERLKYQSEAEVRRIYDRLGCALSPAFDAVLRREARRARKYVSRHRYTLAQFGLSADRMEADLGPVFDRFAFPRASRGD